jgi:butyrate kinase
MSEKVFRVLTINPGSTSTKASIFENDEEVFDLNVQHTQEELDAIKEMKDQGPVRRDAVLKALKEAGQDVSNLDVVVAVGGVGLVGVPYGTYKINDTMVTDAAEGRCAVHPNNMGVIIARELADACGAIPMAAGMASAEEFQEVAHVGGFVETPRRCCVHMLNTKEVALRYAASQGKSYDELNLVIAHVGGGITVAAHNHGKVIDGTDGVDQEGPMSVNRPGTVKLNSFLRLVGKIGVDEAKNRLRSGGGIVNHLGTNDILKVKEMIANGDEYAKLVYDALYYNVGKWIGYCATALKGQVDAVILTGNLVKDQYGVDYLKDMVEWIAPVAVYPGELEQEALAAAALRVLEGEEELLEYSGVPVWDGFDYLKRA